MDACIGDQIFLFSWVRIGLAVRLGSVLVMNLWVSCCSLLLLLLIQYNIYVHRIWIFPVINGMHGHEHLYTSVVRSRDRWHHVTPNGQNRGPDICGSKCALEIAFVTLCGVGVLWALSCPSLFYSDLKLDELSAALSALEQDQSGLMTYIVTDRRLTLATVVTSAGDLATALIWRTYLYSAGMNQVQTCNDTLHCNWKYTKVHSTYFFVLHVRYVPNV